jgi:hypothetical protein
VDFVVVSMMRGIGGPFSDEESAMLFGIEELSDGTLHA